MGLLVVDTVKALLVDVPLSLTVSLLINVAGSVNLHEVQPASPLPVLEMPWAQLH